MAEQKKSKRIDPQQFRTDHSIELEFKGETKECDEYHPIQRFKDAPDCFEEAKRLFQEEIQVWGYVELSEYELILQTCAVVAWLIRPAQVLKP